MACAEAVNTIRVKASVDREKKSVLFMEADAEVADVLFSYLTMPIATVINLCRKQPPVLTLGCFGNLYRSVESLESRHFTAPQCKEMLLRPRNGAAVYCQYLKLNIDDDPNNKQPCFFFCRCRSGYGNMTPSPYPYSYDNTDVCGRCRNGMNIKTPVQCNDMENGLFVKRLSRLVISDDLKVKPASTTATISFLSEHSVRHATAVEELSFDFGVNEALELLMLGLLSKTPLSDVLLKRTAAKQELATKQSLAVVVKQEESAAAAETETADPVALIKLVYSKTKRMVLYAEAGEGFVDFLFSFLVIPLGHVFKQMQKAGGDAIYIPARGCMQNLYMSLQDLVAEEYLVRPRVLQNPMLAAGFGYQNHPLGLEEMKYFDMLIRDPQSSQGSYTVFPVEVQTELTANHVIIREPKLPAAGKEGAAVAGYLLPSMWTITDDLDISPISPASAMAILRKLNVPFSELAVKAVNVGRLEASQLLVASLTSASPLTDVFYRHLN